MGKKYLIYVHHPNFALEAKKSDLINRLLDQHYNNEIPANSPTARTAKDVLRDIDTAKLQLAELLEVNQDPDAHRMQQTRIQELWDEYRQLKEE